jgi:hypothetical protein
MTMLDAHFQRHETKSYIIVPFDKNFSLIIPPRNGLVNIFLKNFCDFLKKFAVFGVFAGVRGWRRMSVGWRWWSVIVGRASVGGRAVRG